MIRSVDAVLYDFDGVLVDSEYYYFLSYGKAFKKFGHRLIAREYWKYFTYHGWGAEYENKRYKLGLTPAQISWIMSQRRLNYSEYVRSGQVPFIEESYATIGLFDKAGKKTAIASNSFEDDIETIFKVHNRKRTIKLIGRKIGLRSKPEPDIFVYASGFVHSEPVKCLVIEDASKGLTAALAIGMPCVIIRNRYNRSFNFPGATLVFNSYTEFHQLTRKAIKRL